VQLYLSSTDAREYILSLVKV